MVATGKLAEAFKGKRVVVTGHTGFKGAWMTEWLLDMGAAVTGVALEPNTQPALFDQLGLAERIDHRIQDIRDHARTVALIREADPEIVFHLAAQPLVRYSYAHPVETYATNVMGTVHVLEALRALDRPCVAVLVTTDKCYENRETGEPYAEDEPMGGHDPYSCSKGAAELVIASYRRSYFPPRRFGDSHAIAVASARAGNVIGGGDWAADRIVPDCMRSLAAREPIPVRNPAATRPWQHVLEPVGGYLWLAKRIAEAGTPERREALCSGFNFGPDPRANRPVRDLVEKVVSVWPGTWIDRSDPDAPHEAGLLNLSIDKAARLLDWRPAWDFDASIEKTVEWYREVCAEPGAAPAATRRQIEAYRNHLDHEV